MIYSAYNVRRVTHSEMIVEDHAHSSDCSSTSRNYENALKKNQKVMFVEMCTRNLHPLARLLNSTFNNTVCTGNTRNNMTGLFITIWQVVCCPPLSIYSPDQANMGLDCPNWLFLKQHLVGHQCDNLIYKGKPIFFIRCFKR